MATILIVDDRPVNRQFLLTLLSYRGHRLLEADDAAYALNLVRSERPNLIIADIVMPNMDGYEFVRRLRADPDVGQTAVAFYTAVYEEREARILAERCGVQHLLTKPCDPEVVLKTVDAALGLTSVAPPAPPQEFDGEHLRLLTDTLSRKVNELEFLNSRLTALVQLGQQLALENDPVRLLDNFCRSARDIIGAGYAAVGIFHEDGQGLRHYATSGVGQQVCPQVACGFTCAEAVRTLLSNGAPRSMSAPGGPQSLGLPSCHPPMRSFLGAAVATSERTYGWLYLADKQSRPHFTEEDEQLAATLAAQLAAACEKARLFDELHHRAEDLAEADRRKDEFLAMLAHELRNPLVPIRTGLDLLAMNRIDPQNIRIMQQQVVHLVRLVDDLLDISRIMRGQIQLRRETVELSIVVGRAVEGARPWIDAQRQRLDVRLPEVPIFVEGDVVRLAQVVQNLLNNAAKYTHPSGEILLTVSEERGEAAIEIRDNGIGICPQLLPRVFDLFVQAERSLDRSQGGLGVGLTIVRNLVELHGGTVAAFSEGEGKGSRFTVRLPLVARAPLQRAPMVEGGLPVGRRVLVVDDHVAVAMITVQIIKELGLHKVEVAHDGASALESARVHRPEIVLLDIGLPQMDGYEVARRLRAQPESASAFIVALTGYGTEEDRRLAMEAGCDRHLVKPASLDDLIEIFGNPLSHPQPQL